MGKRRDRRKQQSSNRRVKLDLSFDDDSPSETPGSLEGLDSSLGENVKAGARNQEAADDNPLSLLGQYSDDDTEEDGKPGDGCPDVIINEELSKLLAEQVREKKNTDVSLVDEQHLACSTNTSPDQTENNVVGDEVLYPGNSPTLELTQQAATSEGDWQAVLHEDTGEYYYWNMRTGETTWVNPLEHRLADGVGSSAGETAVLGTESTTSPLSSEKALCGDGTHGDSSCPDNLPNSEMGSGGVEEHIPSHRIEDECLENVVTYSENKASQEADTDGLQARVKPVLECPEALEKLESFDIPEGSDACGLEKVAALGEGTGKVKEEGEGDSPVERVQQGLEINWQHESAQIYEDTADGSVRSGIPFAAHTAVQKKIASLAERGEALEQRFTNLAGEPLPDAFRHDGGVTLQARIADWKVFGALGFDAHACLTYIEKELTKLEEALEAQEENEREKKMASSATIARDAHEEMPARNDADWESCPQVHETWKQSTASLANDEDIEEGEIQSSHGELHTASASSPEAMLGEGAGEYTGYEDADMDVDMEVDDEVEGEPTAPDVSIPYAMPYDFPASVDDNAPGPHLPVGDHTQYYPVPPGPDSWVPPLPPDDDWAPPPPGETEPAPPPPPDEPPLLAPSAALVQSYTEALVSLGAHVEYYATEYATEYVSLPEYVPAPDYQAAPEVHGAYIEEVPGVYSSNLQPVETLNLEQPYVVASSSSTAYNGWAPTVLSSRPIPSYTIAAAGTSVRKSEASVSSALANVQPVPTVTSTTADSSGAGASLEAKKLAKSKVKKRTHAVAAAPMLNKKVSSLVSKWKQAKEELHGGEDEDEDDKALYDLEVLERKKQQEIEEWRRQQIASGEALDNANFQPLGTLDWRERVKRARKSDAREFKEPKRHTEPPSSEAEGQSQEATRVQKLADLSRGLPAGWQAYWDEASGEVYYGNLTTQETTWDRPVT